MGIRGHGRPGPRPKKTDPIVAAIEPEVVQTPAPAAKKRIRNVANIEAEQRYKEKKLRERKERTGADTFEEFWAASLKGGNQKQIAAWKARQERVFDLMWYIEHNVSGDYNNPASPHYCDPNDTECFVGVEEGNQDLREDLAQYGQCSRAILSLGRFWKNAARMNNYKGDDAVSVLATYGILIAVPTDLVRQWDEYLKEYRKKQEDVTLTCSCGTQTSVHASTAKQILATNTRYHCPKCSDKSTDLIDDWGRLKL